jgi:UDP-N-acetylglucosamine transferase subunit ALG13
LSQKGSKINMNQLFPVKNAGKPLVLVAPLDWGLGHATRCIPLIRELIKQGAAPCLAGEGAQEVLLKTEFPDLPFLPLPGYRIRYPKKGGRLTWKMLRQVPAILSSIRKEQVWLRQQMETYHFDAVISDNRYGLHHPDTHSVFITHQLQIKGPAAWIEKLLQQKNYRYINRFNQCWIPDSADENNLAGQLAHPVQLPAVPLKYIGPLSRFERKEDQPIKGHLLILLSGPEPQRSLLEDIIIQQVSHYSGTATVLRGLPGHLSVIPSTSMIRFYNHLPSEELSAAIQKADYIISRSGYSTMMDMALMGKKCILIPTPGQTEQEYLSDYLHQKNRAISFRQDAFELNAALEAASSFPFQEWPTAQPDLLSNAVKELLNQVVKPDLG